MDNTNFIISPKESIIESTGPKFTDSKQKETKVMQSNPKFMELKEKNKYNLQKELITRMITPSFYSFILLLLIIMGTTIASFRMNYDQVVDFWKIIIPLITTYLGYAIGKNEKGDSKE